MQQVIAISHFTPEALDAFSNFSAICFIKPGSVIESKNTGKGDPVLGPGAPTACF